MASPALRMTMPVRTVLDAFLNTRPGAELYGLEIAERCDLTAGTVYPIVQRLREVGWIEDRWEPFPARRTS